jgi:hypothetical protein
MAIRLVTGAWPLKPGALMPDNLQKFVVKDSTSTEVPIAVSPSRALFPDGSYRSIHVQFEADLTLDTPQTWTVTINGPSRTTTDRAWQEPVYDANNALQASMANNTTFIPANSQYWCDTFAALVPLKPEANEQNDNAKEYFRTDNGVSQTFGSWAATNTVENGGANGLALSTYEHGHAWLCAAIRTNSQAKRLDFYSRFWKWVINRNGGTPYWRIGTQAQTFGAWTNAWGGVDATLPVASSTTDQALPAEWHSTDVIGVAASYIATGWRQPWRWLSYSANRGNRTSSNDVQLNSTYLIRFNLGGFSTWMAAYVCGATMGFGRNNNTTLAANELKWILDAYENNQYTTANSAAYLDGIIGQLPTATDGGGLAPGQFPTFQLMVLARMLIFYYHNIKNDTRIPVWLQRTADFVIAQTWDAGTYYSIPYIHRDSTYGNSHAGIGSASVNNGVMTFTNDQSSWIRVGDTVTIGGNNYAITGYTNGTTWTTSGANIGVSAFTVTWNAGDSSWYLPFFMELFGWVYAHTGNSTYKTWALRAANRRELTNPSPHNPDLKAFGQFFGGHQHSAKFYIDGGSVRPISGAHPTEITQRVTYES